MSLACFCDAYVSVLGNLTLSGVSRNNQSALASADKQPMCRVFPFGGCPYVVEVRNSQMLE